MQATLLYGDTEAVPYTAPETATDPGSVQVVGTIAGVDTHGTAADAVGSLTISGVFRVVKEDAATFAVGASVYWDATSDPFGGVAESGAASTSVEDVLLGVAVAEAAAEEETVDVKLQRYATPSS